MDAITQLPLSLIPHGLEKAGMLEPSPSPSIGPKPPPANLIRRPHWASNPSAPLAELSRQPNGPQCTSRCVTFEPTSGSCPDWEKLRQLQHNLQWILMGVDGIDGMIWLLLECETDENPERQRPNGPHPTKRRTHTLLPSLMLRIGPMRCEIVSWGEPFKLARPWHLSHT